MQKKLSDGANCDETELCGPICVCLEVKTRYFHVELITLQGKTFLGKTMFYLDCYNIDLDVMKW